MLCTPAVFHNYLIEDSFFKEVCWCSLFHAGFTVKDFGGVPEGPAHPLLEVLWRAVVLLDFWCRMTFQGLIISLVGCPRDLFDDALYPNDVAVRDVGFSGRGLLALRRVCRPQFQA